MNTADTDIKALTLRIEKALEALAAKEVKEKFWVTHYGANDIHPKHLVYWICVMSDSEKKRLEDDKVLYRKLRDTLATYEYPISGKSLGKEPLPRGSPKGVNDE